MILLTKARPVRIRIMSDNMEHSSYDSLMRHFSVEDLLAPACDGRLDNWLRQQAKDDVADKIAEIQELLQEKELGDQEYLQFICAFFSEIQAGSIDTISELYQWWSKTKYSKCPECQKLQGKVEAERLKANKAADNTRMFRDYSFARDFCANNPKARTKEEWKEIFEYHAGSHQGDADHWWFMYIFFEEKIYLDNAAKLGHKEAEIKKQQLEDRFIGVNKSNFRLALNNAKGSNQIASIYSNINRLSPTSSEDKILAADILCICSVWDKMLENKGDILNQQANKTANNVILSELSGRTMLTAESMFAEGMMRQKFLQDMDAKCYRPIADAYVPAEAMMKLIEGEAKEYSLVAHFKDKIDTIRVHQFTKPQNLLFFILVHIFDKFTYEKVR